MQQVTRSDPAPSRASYRMQRLMLTPLFRRGLRVGIPLAVVVLGLGVWLGSADRREAAVTALADMRDQFQNRPEFRVNLMAIDGASAAVSADIRDILPIDFPVSSFDLELADVHALIRELPAVADASVRIRQGGVLQIDVTERVPAAVWRNNDGLNLIDGTGAVVRSADMRDAYPDLPLIAGEGANARVGEALQLIGAAGPLLARTRGLVRMGERRWDLVLDRGQRILLPEYAPVQALERVIILSQAQDMLARDLAVVDMRLAERPTIRMNQTAVEEWWQIRQTMTGAGNR